MMMDDGQQQKIGAKLAESPNVTRLRMAQPVTPRAKYVGNQPENPQSLQSGLGQRKEYNVNTQDQARCE
jgi:hypothetical protein